MSIFTNSTFHVNLVTPTKTQPSAKIHYHLLLLFCEIPSAHFQPVSTNPRPNPRIRTYLNTRFIDRFNLWLVALTLANFISTHVSDYRCCVIYCGGGDRLHINSLSNHLKFEFHFHFWLHSERCSYSVQFMAIWLCNIRSRSKQLRQHLPFTDSHIDYWNFLT